MIIGQSFKRNAPSLRHIGLIQSQGKQFESAWHLHKYLASKPIQKTKGTVHKVQCLLNGTIKNTKLG